MWLIKIHLVTITLLTILVSTPKAQDSKSVKTFPDLGIFKLDGYKREELKDKILVVDFWASWCAPCRKEHPNLVRLSKIKNIKLVGVNFKDNVENAKNFLKENGNPFDILAEDKNGKNSVNFGVYGIPETILIDSELKILKKYIGPLNIKDVNEIRKLVKK